MILNPGDGMRRLNTAVRWLGAAAALVAVSACDETLSIAGAGSASISMTLVASDSIQTAYVTQGTSADSSIPPVTVGIGASRVSLRVLDDVGGVFVLTPDVVVGRYRAILSPVLGRRYHLAGSIDGVSVSAETMVPARFAVLTPLSDTLTGATCSNFVVVDLVCVAFQMDFDAAPAFEFRVASGVNAGRLTLVRVASGSLVYSRDPVVRVLDILAYNGDAAAWLFSSTPHSNVTGAFGGFGAAIALRKALYTP